MTTEEALRQVFGRSGAAQVKKLANPPEKGSGRKPKSQVKSTKKESRG
jgi:hypothetical protein